MFKSRDTSQSTCAQMPDDLKYPPTTLNESETHLSSPRQTVGVLSRRFRVDLIIIVVLIIVVTVKQVLVFAGHSHNLSGCLHGHLHLQL